MAGEARKVEAELQLSALAVEAALTRVGFGAREFRPRREEGLRRCCGVGAEWIAESPIVAHSSPPEPKRGARKESGSRATKARKGCAFPAATRT